MAPNTEYTMMIPGMEFSWDRTWSACTRSERPGGRCGVVLPGASVRSAGVIRWGHVLATPARPGRPVGRRAEAAGRPAAGARGGPGAGEPAAAGGERPPQEAAEATEAGAGRHGPGGRGAPAAPDRPRRRAHAAGHRGARPHGGGAAGLPTQGLRALHRPGPGALVAGRP